MTESHENQDGALSMHVFDNRVVWLLAFAPLIGLAIQLAVLSAFGTDLWFLAAVLNIVLCWLDLNRLEATPIDTSSLRPWMLLLVPVYLYRRQKLAGQRGYFATWIACFALAIFGSPGFGAISASYHSEGARNEASVVSSEDAPRVGDQPPQLPDDQPPPPSPAAETSEPALTKDASSGEVIKAQLASLKEQIRIAGNQCVATHDPDTCNEVQALKFQRDAIMESPEYLASLIERTFDEAQKEDAAAETVAPDASQIAGPSFDCAKATTDVEKMICGNPELAKADLQLSEFYQKNIAAAGTGANEIRQGQRSSCQSEISARRQNAFRKRTERVGKSLHKWATYTNRSSRRKTHRHINLHAPRSTQRHV